MTFKSKLGNAALEEFKEVDVANLAVGAEGWKGALKGMWKGSIRTALDRKKVEEEVADLKERLKELQTGIAASTTEKGSKTSAVVKGILQGPAWTGHKLEQAQEEAAALKKQIGEMEAAVSSFKAKGGKSVAKEDNENEDEAAAAAAADPAAKPEGADETAPGTGEAKPEGATGDDGVDATATSAAPATGADDAAAAGAGDAGAAAPGADDAAASADPDAAAAGDPAADPAAADPAAIAEGETAADTSAAAANAEAAAASDPEADAGMDADNAAADEIETEMDAVDNIDAKSAEVDEDVEKLTAATESLEVTVSILHAAAQRGGLDIFGASLVRNNINTVTENLKIKKMVIPALEDMESPSSKIDGATSTAEQLIAFIKRIIDAIKQAFVRFGQWIVEICKRLASAFASAEKRAEALAERVRSGKMVEGKISDASVAKKMVYGSAPVTDVLDAATKLGNFAHYLNDPKTYGTYLKTIDLSEEILKDPTKDEEIRGKISGELGSWAKDLEKHGKIVSDGAREAGKATKVGDAMGTTEQSINRVVVPLFNGQYLGLIIPNAAEGLRRMSGEITAEKSVEVSDIDALNQADAAKLCAIVIGIAKGLRESNEANQGGVKELVEQIKKRNDIIVALGNAGLNKIADDHNTGEAFRKSMLFVNTHMVSAAKLPVHAMNKAMPRNLSALLDYVAASIAGKSDTDVPAKNVNPMPGQAQIAA